MAGNCPSAAGQSWPNTSCPGHGRLAVRSATADIWCAKVLGEHNELIDQQFGLGIAST